MALNSDAAITCTLDIEKERSSEEDYITVVIHVHVIEYSTLELTAIATFIALIMYLSGTICRDLTVCLQQEEI
jgi:hypothetical protein